eukprot:TRINITY_DN1088_c1_g1_i3.p1 TRINITY_DN1088_c1_g1~~TRINITY_DN1088_c1_g1_i3.p1  ORF type:complete len:368 (+),score=63.15 TRINITY_DN1088_c1_g1_i3:566-1669(+)
MFALLLAVAVGVADPQCADFGGSTSYSVQNAKGPATLAFTTAGEAVAAVCVGQDGPVGRTNGHIHILDAFTGAVRNVTKAECAATVMHRTGPFVVMATAVPAKPGNMSFTILPVDDLENVIALTGGVGSIYSLGSNNENVTVVGAASDIPEYQVDVLKVSPFGQGYTDDTLWLTGVPIAVAISNTLGGTRVHYVAIANSGADGVHVVVTIPRQGVVNSFPLPAGTGEVLALKFYDEGPYLAIVTVTGTLIYNIRSGWFQTYANNDWYTSSVAFNDDGSWMAVSGSRGGFVGGTPYIYMLSLRTGAVQTLCQQEMVDKDHPANNYASLSYATDAQGRGVILSRHQKNTTHMVMQTFRVPNTTDVGRNN